MGELDLSQLKEEEKKRPKPIAITEQIIQFPKQQRQRIFRMQL